MRPVVIVTSTALTGAVVGFAVTPVAGIIVATVALLASLPLLSRRQRD